MNFSYFRVSIFLIICILLFIKVFDVEVKYDKTDENLIINYFKLPKVKSSYTYKEKIDLTKKVVHSISSFGSFKSIPHKYEKNLTNFVKFKQGLCFDRSIIYEIIFKYYGFKVHHYYVGFNDSKIRVLFRKRTISHAFISIEIDGEELFIDSNQYFLSVDKNDVIIKSFFTKIRLNKFYDKALWWTSYFKEYKSSLIVRGLYSRNGFFFKPFLPIPDVNFYDFRIFWNY